MEGVIELRKNALVFVPDIDPSTCILLPKSANFLRGDRAINQSNTITLVHRVPGTTVAVVESPTSLFFPTYDSSLPHITNKLSVGDRVQVKLGSHGSVTIESVWPRDPRTDVSWLQTTVQHIPVRPVPPVKQGLPLYTRSDIVDHTDLGTFTIDPTSSVDFDDAISVDLSRQTVYVHIVDIAHADLTETEEAKLRSQCLTLYLANEGTEHLLDLETASDRLSLVQGKPRQVVTVAMKVAHGLIESYEIYRSIIIVKRRYTYDEVTDLLTSGGAGPALLLLNDLTHHRSAQINYNLTLPSIRFTMDQSSGLPISLKAEATNDDAHSLVATAMIMANLVISQHLAKANIKLPNRFHDTLRGIPIQEPVTGNPVVDSFVLVKKFARAKYSVDEKGHFGLGLTDYVHFTSPMRRYADVLVHRLLAGVQYDNLETEVEAMNRQSTAMRGYQTLYQKCKLAWWVQDMNGPYEVFCTDVKAVGIQWFLPALSLNGFTHVSALEPKQRWSWKDGSLTGPSGTTVRLGSILEGTVMKVDPVTLAITLQLVA
uniref:RNB domain-containing protein n=1 Tax=viral metagenome TaxID=1070528 RepID=A0A6C0DGJ5_9ZZZZ